MFSLHLYSISSSSIYIQLGELGCAWQHEQQGQEAGQRGVLNQRGREGCRRWASLPRRPLYSPILVGSSHELQHNSGEGLALSGPLSLSILSSSCPGLNRGRVVTVSSQGVLSCASRHSLSKT